MKVKSKLKLSKERIRKTKPNESCNSKLKVATLQPILKHHTTAQIDKESISLIVDMDSSFDIPVPEILKNVEHEERGTTNENFKEQQLSDLVRPLNYKNRKSQINRIPVSQSIPESNRTHKKNRFKNGVFINDLLQINKSEEKYTSADGIEFYILSNSKVLMILTESMSLHFNGSLKIQVVLMGKLEVLGYLINHESGLHTTYSTRGNSHLCLKALSSKNETTSNFTMEKNVVEQYLRFNMKNNDKLKVLSSLSEKSVVLVLHKNNDALYSDIWPKFLYKHCSSYSLFTPVTNTTVPRIFLSVEKVLNVTFELPTHDITCKLYNELPQWLSLEDEIVHNGFVTNKTTKTVLIGGKGVGKSTLLRYLVNKCLRKWNKILVLDFDIGQSEFTVPGCVSAVLVDKPLLGPNFTHLMNPIRSVFVGDVDPVPNLETYMKSFKQVIEFCTQQATFQNIPWFINTMGFTKALGLSITASIIQKVVPTHVIQIYSNDKTRNFDKILTNKVVNEVKFGKHFEPFPDLSYVMHYIPSGAEVKNEKHICSKEWGIQPKRGRLLMLFSYLSTMLTPQRLNLLELVPYVVSISKLHLEVHGTQMTQAQAVVTMNGNLVALCCKDNKQKNFPDCLGFGIVRGVDFENDKLFLITPLQLGHLQNVNCLVKGNVSLPHSFILEPEGPVTGHVPYVSYTSKSHTTQEAKREFNPNKSSAGSFIKSY